MGCIKTKDSITIQITPIKMECNCTPSPELIDKVIPEKNELLESSRILLYKKSLRGKIIVINVLETDGDSTKSIIEKQVFEISNMRKENVNIN